MGWGRGGGEGGVWSRCSLIVPTDCVARRRWSCQFHYGHEMIKPASGEATTDNLHLVRQAVRCEVKFLRLAKAKQKMPLSSEGEGEVQCRKV